MTIFGRSLLTPGCSESICNTSFFVRTTDEMTTHKSFPTLYLIKLFDRNIGENKERMMCLVDILQILERLLQIIVDRCLCLCQTLYLGFERAASGVKTGDCEGRQHSLRRINLRLCIRELCLEVREDRAYQRLLPRLLLIDALLHLWLQIFQFSKCSHFNVKVSAAIVAG